MDAYNSTVAEAEQGILSSIISHQPSVGGWMECLKPGHFSDNRNQVICSNIMQLCEGGSVIDRLVLQNHLIKNKQIEQAGGNDYLRSLDKGVHDRAIFDKYLEIVQDASIKRELISTGEQFSAWGKDTGRDAMADLKEARTILSRMEYSYLGNYILDATSLCLSEIRDLDAKMQSGEPVRGIACGLHEVDRITGGFGPGELIIVAARPAMGKSAFLLSLLENAAIDNGEPLACFSLEMSAQHLTQRLFSIRSHIPFDKIRKGNLEGYEHEILMSKADEIKNAPFFMIDEPGISPERIRMIARDLRSRSNIKMILVDYLQLMGGSTAKKWRQSREQEVSDMTRTLKNIARELDIAVVVTSQLSRAVETRGGDKKPILSDLRESGAIEQDADKVLFLYRGEYYGLEQDCEGNSTKDIAEVIVAKNRFGPVGTARTRFINRFAIFENLDFPEQPGGYDRPGNAELKKRIREKHNGIFDDKRDDDFPAPF